MPKKMSRVGLSPAEEARSGTMSEAKRKKYARGGYIRHIKPNMSYAEFKSKRPDVDITEEGFLDIRDNMNVEGEYTPRSKRKGRSSRYAKGGQMQQGYNARKDEQLGMTRGKEAGKKMSMKGRRDVAKATRKPRGSYGFTAAKGGGLVGKNKVVTGYKKGGQI